MPWIKNEIPSGVSDAKIGELTICFYGDCYSSISVFLIRKNINQVFIIILNKLTKLYSSIKKQILNQYLDDI